MLVKAADFNIAFHVARTIRQKSQAQLARDIDESRDFVCELECGRRTAPFETWCKVAKALNFPAVAIMPGGSPSLITKAVGASAANEDPADAALALIESIATDPEIRQFAPDFVLDLATVALRTRREIDRKRAEKSRRERDAPAQVAVPSELQKVIRDVSLAEGEPQRLTAVSEVVKTIRKNPAFRSKDDRFAESRD